MHTNIKEEEVFLRPEAVAVKRLRDGLEHVRPRALDQQRLPRRKVPQKQTRVIQVRNLNLPGPAPATAPLVAAPPVPSPPLPAPATDAADVGRRRQVDPRNRRRGLRQDDAGAWGGVEAEAADLTRNKGPGQEFSSRHKMRHVTQFPRHKMRPVIRFHVTQFSRQKTRHVISFQY